MFFITGVGQRAAPAVQPCPAQLGVEEWQVLCHRLPASPAGSCPAAAPAPPAPLHGLPQRDSVRTWQTLQLTAGHLSKGAVGELQSCVVPPWSS